MREPVLDRQWETMLDHRCCTRELLLDHTRERSLDRLSETTLNHGFIFVCWELPLDHMRELMVNRVWEVMLNHVIS
ncbi:hypothetical protein PC110_g23179 [Phytophthora cactorum]|nr:hypothetical protein PC110_g23179 [Phytophthora cactorum]